MATSREILKGYFKKGAKPTERQFVEMIGAFLHREEENEIQIGGKGKSGQLILQDALNKETIKMDGFNPQINLYDPDGRRNIVLDGKNSAIHLGFEETNGMAGTLMVYDSMRRNTIVLDGQDSTLDLGRKDAKPGYLRLFDTNHKQKIILNASDSTIKVDKGGKITMKNSNDLLAIELDGEKGAIKAINDKITTPDFILEPSYELLSIDELNQFIQKNKHLPDIPSGEQIKAEGINLPEFSLKLLQKIEELTLYVIDLQKQIDELKKR